MNKQELIKILEAQPYETGILIDTVKFNRKWLLRMIEQLDEPEKVKVPQFVADWYEANKDDFDYNVWECVFNDGKGKETEMSEWICKTENAIQTLVNMHQFAYEVEEEKRYLVRVRGICGNHEFLNCEKHSKKWLFSDRKDNTLYATKFTRKELEEAGFGWVFDCEGVEIEEVE